MARGLLMKILVKRTQKIPENDAIFGELYIDDTIECLTLERLSKSIPVGIYPISLYFSPHNHCQVPLLENVPERSNIEIHVANYPAQLEGCIAVGTTHNQEALSNSRFAFNQLMSQIVPDGLTVEISEEF